MNIDLIISADYLVEDKIRGKSVVVIDILRATTVITTAIMNGCKKVIPLLTVEEAYNKRQELTSEECILGGERRAVKIDGFDFSNSPLEYKKDVVKDKTLIITTTNGTRTLTKCNKANTVIVGCMLNSYAVAKKLLDLGRDIVIVNAGTNGEFSMDDFICSGSILQDLINIKKDLQLSDIAKVAVKAYNSYPNVIDYIKDARHYSVMINLGLEKDIDYCIQKNMTDIVPIYKNGIIR